MTKPEKQSHATTGDASSSPQETFGLVEPWSEPAWYNYLESPYYNDSHRKLRAYIRNYIDEHVKPHALEWEEKGEAPREEALRYAQSGLAFADVPMEFRPEGQKTVAGIPIDQLDAFHMLIITDETSRVEGGVMSSLGGGTIIGGPPIINHGTHEQKQRWLPGLFDWSTSFCLGITEATGGSDVSAIRTTATLTDDGAHYIVTGHKKWITGAPWATHMTTAVRTGGPGAGGLSLLVIPLSLEGVSIRRIANSGQHAGGSSWVTLRGVRVPSDHLLGAAGAGFGMVMTNFNKERFVMAVGANRKSRTCLATALVYAHERETFGAPLVARQLVRHKLATLARYVESHWAWLEQLAFHVQRRGWQAKDIGGRIALAKVHAGRILEMAAREAQQVLGGVGYQRGGVGGSVEQISRDLRMTVVGGGSEEILGELAFREESKRARQLGSKL